MELKYIHAIDDGTSDWQAIRDNFDEIEDNVNENNIDFNSLAKKVTTTLNYAIENEGVTTVLNGGKHLRLDITNAYVQLGDNIDKDIIIEIEGISDSLRFSNTEKAGKIKIFKVLKSTIMFNEDLKVKTNSDRKILIGITGESNE